jgi:hypothetical protein
MKLTTHLHLVSTSRMRGAIPPLPNTPSRRGAQLKHRDNFIFTLRSESALRPILGIHIADTLCQIFDVTVSHILAT